MTIDASVAPVLNARPEVIEALRTASAQTGSDFHYLLGTAMRESSLDSEAKSRHSSATGLFQFVDQTWLSVVKRYGDEYGLSNYADAIHDSGNGHFTVSDKDTKAAILALRKDPQLSALMAGASANETKQSLECALGRKVCGGELYAAHFLGEGGARRLIALNEKNPNCAADQEFPQAAKANHNVFYHADGSAKSVREIYSWVTDLPEVSPANLPAAKPVDTKPVSFIAAATQDSAGGGSFAPLTDEIQPAPAQTAGASLASLVTRFKQVATAPQALPAAVLPQPPLQLSAGIVEILASLTPLTLAWGRRAN